MLANAVVLSAIVMLATVATLSAQLAMTRATIHRQAAQYIQIGFDRAAASLQSSIASGIRNGTLDPRALASPLPAFTPLPVLCVGAQAPCSDFTTATIVLTNTVDVAASATPFPCDARTTNCALALESDAHVDEGRVAAQIVVRILAADGTLLATRAENVTLRTFATAPYAAVSGARDRSFDAPYPLDTEGDDGGLRSGAAPSACASSAPPDDTTVRVAYVNARSGACTDGSRWQQDGWSNANGNTSGWTP